MAGTPPLLFTSEGPIPTPPTTLYNALITQVAASVPGYTANLPGSLIDDVAGTMVAGLSVIDQARVDAVNSVSPTTANPYILNQQGQQFGIPTGEEANGNADVVFTGTPGYVIPAGFLVGDGTNQYAVQDGGTVGSGGTSQTLEVVCTNSNSFAIAPGAIDQIITSVPTGYTLTVTNAEAGTPAQAPETIESYRSQLQQAFQFALQGGPTVLKTLLQQVPGVQPRLISVLQTESGAWEVICGGGDPYQVAGAIYQGVSSIGLLTGSSVSSGRNITASIFDAPNTYSVVFVNPPEQEVTVAITWNTTLANFTASAAVNQYMIQATQAYMNGIIVGQPINLLVLTEQIQEAIASVLAPVNLTTLEFVVKYNGTTQDPTAGTSIIPPPDNETYLYSSATDITATQG